MNALERLEELSVADWNFNDARFVARSLPDLLKVARTAERAMEVDDGSCPWMAELAAALEPLLREDSTR